MSCSDVSQDADKFWRMPEAYIRGNTIKYVRVPEEVMEKVQEENLRRDGELFSFRASQTTLSLHVSPSICNSIHASVHWLQACQRHVFNSAVDIHCTCDMLQNGGLQLDAGVGAAASLWAAAAKAAGARAAVVVEADAATVGEAVSYAWKPGCMHTVY
eukprot:363764-Chlamydomonas_euryale.AAC.9